MRARATRNTQISEVISTDKRVCTAAVEEVILPVRSRVQNEVSSHLRPVPASTEETAQAESHHIAHVVELSYKPDLRLS